MADEKIRVTELPVATEIREGGKILVTQNGVDYQVGVEKILKADSNLAEVEASQARANLNIYSRAETDERVQLSAKAFVATDIANGLANTTVGQLFVVPQGVGADQSFIFYRNMGTTASAVADQPGTGAINDVREEMDSLNNRTDGLHTSSQSVNPFEILDAEGKALMYLDSQGRMFVPAGLTTKDVSLVSLTIEQLKSTIINGKELYWLNERLSLTDAPDWSYAETDASGQVLFGTRKSDGKKVYLGWPLQNKIGLLKNDFFFIGDSITAFSQASSNGNTNTNRNEAPAHCDQSWPMWAEMQSDGRIKFAGVSATGGYTAAQILATHVPVAVAANPTFCVVLAGRNNIVQNKTYEETVADLKAIYDSLRRAGITPVLCSMSAQSGNSAAQDTLRYRTNEFIRAYADRNQLPFVDFHEVTTNAETGQWMQDDWHFDASHPTGKAAKVMGAKLAEVMKPWVRNNTPRMAVNVTDPASSTNRLENPLFFSSADGINPDSWTVNIAGTSTLKDDAAVKGKVWSLGLSGSTQARRSKVIDVTAGKKYGFGFKARFTTDAANHCYVLTGGDQSASTYVGGVRRWVTSSEGFGYFYQEFTVPAGVTQVTIVISASGLDLAQMGLFEITEV